MTAREWTSRKTAKRKWIVALIVIVAAVAGCEPRQLAFGSGPQENGLVIYAPGIDGCTGPDETFCRELGEQLGCAVEVFDWTLPLLVLENQCDEQRNREMAKKLAQRIRQFRNDHPGAPVLLIGHSGGTAIAVWAAEHLKGEPVDGIILLASSLSPQYDLSTAMEGTRSGIISFYSHEDPLLGGGTALMGTMDRQFCEAAGKVGFNGSGAQNDAAYSGMLCQVPWTPGMTSLGNDGGHYACLATQFAAVWMHPLIRQRLPGSQLANGVNAPVSWPLDTTLATR